MVRDDIKWCMFVELTQHVTENKKENRGTEEAERRRRGCTALVIRRPGGSRLNAIEPIQDELGTLTGKR